MLDKDSLNNEISVGVTLASLMAAISLFFTGAIISQYSSFEPTIKVPLLLLIFSTFSFIFAATIYNNAGSEVTMGKLKTVEKYMIFAKNIVEFLGLYPLILSTPLVIGALTNDSFLRTTTTIVAVVGICLYSQSKFSILEKQLPRLYKQLYSLAVVTVALLLYIAQALPSLDTISYYTIISLVLLAVLLVPTIYFSVRSQQYRVVLVRRYKPSDAAGLARLVERNNKLGRKPRAGASPKKPQHHISEADIATLAAEQQLFVAVIGSRRVGFVCLQDNRMQTIFTDPDLHRKGIGRMLVDAAELAAESQGHEETEVYAHTGSHRFFKRIGYTPTGDDADGYIIMRKEL